MATPKEMRRLIGKRIRFESNRSGVIHPLREIIGVVEDQVRGETHIGGDWHDTKSIKVIEVVRVERY